MNNIWNVFHRALSTWAQLPQNIDNEPSLPVLDVIPEGLQAIVSPSNGDASLPEAGGSLYSGFVDRLQIRDEDSLSETSDTNFPSHPQPSSQTTIHSNQPQTSEPLATNSGPQSSSLTQSSDPTRSSGHTQSSSQTALHSNQAQICMPLATNSGPQVINRLHPPKNRPPKVRNPNERRNQAFQHSNQQSNPTTRTSSFPILDLVNEGAEPVSRRVARRRRAEEQKTIQDGVSQPRPESEPDPPLAASTSLNVPLLEYVIREERALVARSYTARYATVPSANPPSSNTARQEPRRSSFHNGGHQRTTRPLGPQVPLHRHVTQSNQASSNTISPQGRWQSGPPPQLVIKNSPCLICLEVPRGVPSLRPTSRCAHMSIVCAPCLEQHISYAVSTRGSTTLTCPDPECRKVMEYADILAGARGNKVCLDRYETLLLRRTLEKEPNFVWCKNPGCDWGQVHESGAAAPIVICRGCGSRSCFTHDMPWHFGLTCGQYTARQHAEREAQDHASQAYIYQNTKACPNCRRRIEKSEGCNHMTCLRPAGCGHEFCWICLVDYEPIRREGNHRHNPTCTDYRGIETGIYAPMGAYGDFGIIQEQRRLREQFMLIQNLRVMGEDDPYHN